MLVRDIIQKGKPPKKEEPKQLQIDGAEVSLKQANKEWNRQHREAERSGKRKIKR
jgi:hypothetical protein